jgi:hypothetical protein
VRKCSADLDWAIYEKFLLKNYSRKYALDLLKYSKNYYHCLKARNLSELKILSRNKKLHAMKALSALSKFTGVYNHYKDLIKAYALKWTVNNDDIIISRLTRYHNNGSKNDLFKWINEIKSQIPEFAIFIDFILVTGMRFNEAIKSYNLVIKLKLENKLGEYYNFDEEILEHFRFKDLFIRKTKKLFISFVSEDMINAICSINSFISNDMLVKKLQRRGLKQKFSEIRELYASCAVKHLRQPEIDFLQGRVSSNVFMRNYFNPTWIVDLKKRALDHAKELLKISK